MRNPPAAGLKTTPLPYQTGRVPYVDLKHIPIRPANPFARWQKWLGAGTTFMFAGSVLLVGLKTWNQDAGVGTKQAADALLLLVTAASTLVSLCSQLPAQNVILVAVLIGAFTGLVHFVNAMVAVPLGPLTYHTENVGRFMISPLPWSVPVLWVVIILNARGVARLMLRSRRRTSHYGFWVMGTTVLLVGLFELGFQPYATHVTQYWSWKPTKLPWDWYSTPWSYFLGCSVMTLLLLLFVTPAMINKHPNPKRPSFHPLLIWEALSALILLGALSARLSAAVVAMLIQMTATAVLSIVGAGKRSARS